MAMFDRRQMLLLSGAGVLALAGPSFAMGGTAAISSSITGPVKLRMRATSISEGTHWGIYVQEVAIRESRIVPLALIACFEFGRKQDPFVYPELMSPILPIVAARDEPYKVAVYFFENSEIKMQPHSDMALLANQFEIADDPTGRTLSMKATYWDRPELPTAVVHEINIAFEYL